MRIGHYDSELWSQGGISSYIRRVSQAQRVAGHQVHFFSSYPPHHCSEAWETPQLITSEPDLFHQAQVLGLDILHLHKPVKIPPPASLNVIRTVHGHQPYCPSGSKFLKRWSKACDRAYNPFGCLWGHYVDQCGSIRPQNTQFNFQYTSWERNVLPNLPVLTVSQFLKNEMAKAGYSTDAIQVLHLPAPSIANSVPPPQDEIPRFVYAGRITPEKGLEFLLQALHRVSIPVHLDIAGEGYFEPELRSLVQRLGMSERVTFHGWLNSAQTSVLIRSARAIVFPSLWHEPAGFISLEAAAASRALITTRVGGIPEYAKRLQNAWLIEPGEVGQLAEAMSQLAQDWEAAKKLGESGRANVQNYFTLQQHIGKLHQIYFQLQQSNREKYLCT